MADRGDGLDLDAIAETTAPATSPTSRADPDAAPGREAPLARRARPLLVAALLVAAVVLPLLRQTGTPSWQTIFSEDGSIYAQQALRSGGAAVLLRGYAGYLQLPPRLLALVVSLIPLRSLALYDALAGSVVTALLAWFLFDHSDGWIPSPWLRGALASTVVLAPMLLVENTANITNTIWAFAAVVPWALISTRRSGGAVVARSVVAFLAATATALSFLYLPVAIGIIVWRRTRADATVGAVFGAGLVLQAVVTLRSPQQPTGIISQAGQLADETGLRVFWATLAGPRSFHRVGSTDSRWLLLAGPVLVLALLVAVSWGAARPAKVVAAAFAAYAVGMFVVPTWGRGTLTMALGGLAGSAVEYRFSVIPVVLLLSAVMVVMDDPTRHRATGWLRAARILLVTQIIVLALASYRGSDSRSYPSGTAKRSAFSAIVDDTYREACHSLPSNQVVSIPAAYFYPILLPCHDLAP